MGAESGVQASRHRVIEDLARIRVQTAPHMESPHPRGTGRVGSSKVTPVASHEVSHEMVIPHRRVIPGNIYSQGAQRNHGSSGADPLGGQTTQAPRAYIKYSDRAWARRSKMDGPTRNPRPTAFGTGSFERPEPSWPVDRLLSSAGQLPGLGKSVGDQSGLIGLTGLPEDPQQDVVRAVMTGSFKRPVMAKAVDRLLSSASQLAAPVVMAVYQRICD